MMRATKRLPFRAAGFAALVVAGASGLDRPSAAQLLPLSNGGAPRVYSHHYNSVAATNTVEVVRGANGRIYHLVQHVSGWTATNLTAATNTPTAAGNPGVYYHHGAHSVVFRATGGAGHIFELYAYGSPHQDPSGPWHAANLSAMTNAPAALGDPFAYLRSDGVATVIYRGAGNHIYELHLQADGVWRVDNLTLVTGAPAAAGNPIGITRFDDVNAVYYRGSNGQIHELSLAPGGAWQHATITSAAGAPPSTGDPDAYHRFDGLAVVYRSADGHVRELFLPAGGGGWVGNDLTVVTGTPSAAGNPSGYSRPPRWTEFPYQNYWMPSVVYRGANGYIYELFLDVDGAWKSGNLTLLTRAAAAGHDPVGYPNGDVTSNVIYRSTSGHLSRIWMSASIPGTWRAERLFASPDTP